MKEQFPHRQVPTSILGRLTPFLPFKIILALCTAGCLLLSDFAVAHPNRPLAIKDARVNDGTSAPPETGVTVTVEAGLSPMDMLVAATRYGARAMGRSDDFGTIDVGKGADLVLLERNPLEDIGNVRSVSRVLRGGTVWEREELEYK